MYHKSSKGLAKHLDFMLLDLICLLTAYFAAYYIRHRTFFSPNNQLYWSMILVFVLSQVLVSFFYESFKNILKRGYFQEFTASFWHVLLTELLSIFCLFLGSRGNDYSRSVVAFMSVIYLLLTYTARCLWKKILLQGTIKSEERLLIVLTTADMAEEVIGNLEENKFSGLHLTGLVLAEETEDAKVGDTVAGVPVVCDMLSMADYVCREGVDEVFVSLPREVPLSEKMCSELIEMGVTVHLRILRAVKLDSQQQNIGKMGTYTVLSSSINMMSMRQVLGKRLLDIIGGCVGCLITAVLCLFIGPLIYISSPGPIFYSQERMGRNGRKFRLYKFRSMYMDADERKAALMEQNAVKDGMMFKMEHDPRIIGGEKGIGGFIRRFSLDEFPQFWNVLKGDMSLVGTRPPTVEEWEKYDLHHRVRMAAKPGITGMWQVSGRSKITDFEKVVELDKKYIMEWSMGLDFKILLRTVGAVLMKDGAM